MALRKRIKKLANVHANVQSPPFNPHGPAYKDANRAVVSEAGRVTPASAPGTESIGYKPERGTDIYVYFTEAGGTKQLLAANETVKVKLELQTAGPVAVSTKHDIEPVLSGKGRLLSTGRETTIIIVRGDRLYITSSSVNRVAVTIEPIPWLQNIAMLVEKLVKRF